MPRASRRVVTGPPIDRTRFSAKVGRELRIRRERRDLSQGRVAALLGFGQGSLSRMENGAAAITLDTLEAWARVFGTTASDVIAAVEEGRNP